MKTSGVIKFKLDGENHFIAGAIEYTTGAKKREEVVTADGTILAKEVPTAATIEGKVQQRSDFNWKKFQELEGVNILLDLGIGKQYSFTDCFYAGEGKGSSETGELDFRFVAQGGSEEVTS